MFIQYIFIYIINIYTSYVCIYTRFISYYSFCTVCYHIFNVFLYIYMYMYMYIIRYISIVGWWSVKRIEINQMATALHVIQTQITHKYFGSHKRGLAAIQLPEFPWGNTVSQSFHTNADIGEARHTIMNYLDDCPICSVEETDLTDPQCHGFTRCARQPTRESGLTSLSALNDEVQRNIKLGDPAPNSPR